MSHLVGESYEATSVLQEEGESDSRFQGTDLLGNRRSHGGILALAVRIIPIPLPTLLPRHLALPCRHLCLKLRIDSGTKERSEQRPVPLTLDGTSRNSTLRKRRWM